MLIKNVNIVDARKSIYGSVLIENGYIKDIFENVCIENHKKTEVIDGKGLTLMPSFIDMHVHLRDPGSTHKEDLESGQKAALKGGFTHLASMANTKPTCDNEETIKYILNKKEKLDLCEINQISSLTKNLEGKELVNFEKMRQFTKLFSDDGVTVYDENIMKIAMKKSNELNFTLLTHCDPEIEIVKRDLKLLEEIKANLHICHISLRETLDEIKKYKNNGYLFTCEVTPHHIFSSDIDYKVNPSIGSIEDINAMIQGIKDGYIDIIATDHAPHTNEDKINGAKGISLIEVAFSMSYKVFKENNISINLLSEMLSLNPANILKIQNTGLIEKGYEGNLVLVDLNNEYKIDTNEFISKGKNNPFNGYDASGKVVMTIKKGEIKYDNR